VLRRLLAAVEQVNGGGLGLLARHLDIGLLLPLPVSRLLATGRAELGTGSTRHGHAFPLHGAKVANEGRPSMAVTETFQAALRHQLDLRESFLEDDGWKWHSDASGPPKGWLDTVRRAS
jgi:hypothetical protein